MITTTERLDVTNRIHRNNPVREAFAGFSTGCKAGSGRIGYYDCKGNAVGAFEGALSAYGLKFAEEDCMSLDGNDGWKTLRVCNGGDCCVGSARLSWHRMESGSYEFTGYLS